MCKIFFKCNNCNNTFELNKRYINFNNLEDLNNITCTKCSKSISISNNKSYGKCTKCGKETDYRNHYGYCKKCENIFNEKNKQRFLSKMQKGTCVICKKEVNSRDIVGRCIECHNSWYKNHNSSEKMKKIQIEHGKKLCIENQKPGLCKICGNYNEKRNSAGICSNCLSIKTIENKAEGNCVICGKYVKQRDTVGRCFECRSNNLSSWINSNEFKEIAKNNRIKILHLDYVKNAINLQIKELFLVYV